MHLADLDQNTIFKYFVILLIVVSLLIIIREVFLNKGPLTIPEFEPYSSEINIDFDLLADPELEKLISLDELEMPETYGRTNPFDEY